MSPIKGLTEKRRLPRIGKIHLGIMAETKKGVPYPKAVDYFVFPSGDAPGADLHSELVKTFGEKPRELRVIFPLEDEERIASQYYRCYSKTRGLICKGDGEKSLRLVDANTGSLADRDSQKVEMREMVCQGRDCPDYAKKCKELMNLQFILPEISGLGIWQIDTGSINSIRNINGCLDLIRSIYNRISMVPLILALEQIDVVNPDDGKKKKVWVLNLRSTDNMIQAAMKARMKPLELITGISEDIMPDEVLETPVPDDERPALVTPDHEGLAGEPIPEDQKITPEQALEDAKILWPQDEQERMTVEEAAGRMTPTELAVATAEAEAETKLDFDTDWLMESLKQVKWIKPGHKADLTIKSYLKSSYHVDTEGTVIDVVARLTREQREGFIKELQNRLEMV